MARGGEACILSSLIFRVMGNATGHLEKCNFGWSRFAWQGVKTVKLATCYLDLLGNEDNLRILARELTGAIAPGGQ